MGMTREEAIAYFKDMNECTYGDVEPIQMAIKALEQESCEDVISRQAAIDAIKKIHPVDTEYDCTLYDKIDVMYVLKDLPSIKALEQEPILDKIKAEIEQERVGYPPSADYYKAIMKCLQIIDKCKAESEVKE